VKHEEVFHRVKEEINGLHTVKRKKADCIGHILRRKCVVKTRSRRNDRRDEKRRKKK
jgi:hypothetical protein